ncbi:hypothetical protein B0919_09615 [Hymenobacter sp. CRA2]|nr:hypothetical protein B0919_09615 [Hymenobacter sp. CRA2]
MQPLYQAIRRQQVLRLHYRKFGAPEADERIVHPFVLKEYNHRWFLLARDQDFASVSTFALDRIVSFEPDSRTYRAEGLNPTDFFSEVIGATVPAVAAEEIRLLFRSGRGEYVLTKKLHHSQLEISRTGEELEISLRLRINRELETVLLGFGEDVEVLAPSSLRERIKQRLQRAAGLYFS